MNFYTAKQIAEKWDMSVQLVRRYCKEGRIKSAFQYEGQWLIPENAKAPDACDEEEKRTPPLLKKMLYQMERNNHVGIYEYVQVNLAYSSSRMASNRLTRQQVQEIYRTNRISLSFEATKVDDIIEIANHFMCMRYVLEQAEVPLTTDFIKRVHYLLVHGTYSDKRNKVSVGAFRSTTAKWGVKADRISKELAMLLQNYEKKSVDLEQILDFHVRFEYIHPFDDYNGRVGRLLMIKECLRHNVDPFIIDDKRSGAYKRGIANWDTDPEMLKTVAYEAQKRFQGKLEVCQLMQYHRPPNR